MNGSDEIRARIDGTRTGEIVGILNARSGLPVFVSMVSDYLTFNAAIGAEYGEIVPVVGVGASQRLFLWVDDSGAIQSPPRMLNPAASVLAGQAIRGDALILATEGGETVSIGSAAASALVSALVSAVDSARRR